MANVTISHVGELVHWVKIEALNSKTGERAVLFWRDLPWHVRSKWDWYFKYRYGLMLVRYKRWHVHLSWDHGPATGRFLAQHRRNVVRAKKAKITEYVNKMAKWKANWTNLFPIEEQPFWVKALAKIERTRAELAEAERLAEEVGDG